MSSYQPPTRGIFSKSVNVLVVMTGLFIVSLVIIPMLNKSPSIVLATWQKITLLQEELPQNNSLPSPLPNRHLSDTWGGARSEGRRHEGIDIFAPRGTPIQATTKGVVNKVGDDRLGGRVAFIIGAGGAAHYYAHLESYADISPNDWVDAGDIIGYVGDSGNAKGTPPHVHYGVYINGSAVNPYPLLIK